MLLFFISESDNLTLAVMLVFLVSLFVQLFYYLFFYLRIAWIGKNADIKNNDPLSVIICARNEARNLEKFLPGILTQEYPEYEVIVVNDCSEDNTEEILKKFASSYSHLKFTTIKKDEKFVHGKKLALTIGIKSAKHEILVLTDSDCYVTSRKWLSGIAGKYDEKTEIVLGYGDYETQPGFLNKLIRYDTLTIGIQYLTFAHAGIPYMGVGRNLSYRKELFFRNKGFATHARLDSGDDDLFINETACKTNTVVMIGNETKTMSVPKKAFADWLFQKRRHRSTFNRYKAVQKFLLFTEPFSRTLFWASFIILLFLKVNPVFLIVIFLFRLLCQIIVYYFAVKRLNEKKLWLYSPIFDFIFIFIGLIIVFSGKHRNLNPWR